MFNNTTVTGSSTFHHSDISGLLPFEAAELNTPKEGVTLQEAHTFMEMHSKTLSYSQHK